VLTVKDLHTEAELTAKVIQYSGRFGMKKLSLWGNDYHCEKRVIGSDNVGERICRWSGKTRGESTPNGNLANLVKSLFLPLGLGLPHRSALATPIAV